MPAAAAGVLAAEAAVGSLGTDPQRSDGIRSPAPTLFISGIAVLFAGALAHTSGHASVRSAHYALMPAGTAVIIAGVAVAASRGNARGTTHGMAGYIILGSLALQSAVGTWLYLRKGPRYPTSAGLYHRVSGALVLLAVSAVAITGSQTPQYASYHRSDPDAVLVFAALASAVSIALLIKSIHHLRSTPHPTPAQPRYALML